MPEVPTPGKNEQSDPSVAPRTGPGPQGGWRCSSLEPAISKWESRGLTAIVGSFCLLVGKTAVVSDVGSPATWGLLALASDDEEAAARVANKPHGRLSAIRTTTCLE